jgi:hypothetical protein
MANIINRQQTFSTNGTVTAAGLHNLIDTALVNSAIIKNQQEITTIGTADLLLIAPDSVDSSLAPRKVTVQNLLDDGLTAGTFTTLNLTGALTYGTATGDRTVSTSATITTGTIPNLTAGTTTSTAATITNGTITTALIPTLTVGTTTGTAGIFTSGTVATLNSTTGTIANLSTTLAGDFTISQGTATLATSGATAGTYGSVTAIPFLTVDAKGRITSATSGTFSTTPADGSITPAKLSQPFTSGTSVNSTSGTAIDFTSIPSWVKRVTVMLNGVSTNGTSPVAVQLGKSGGVETTGYSGFGIIAGASATAANIIQSTANTVGFNTSARSYIDDSAVGIATISNISGNTWVFSSNTTSQDFIASLGNGAKTLGGTIDRVRITTVNGTNTFDAGSINIMYEG